MHAFDPTNPHHVQTVDCWNFWVLNATPEERQWAVIGICSWYTQLTHWFGQ